LRQVPPLETMGALPQAQPTAVPTGPGPIHGQADYHIVILSAGLSVEWFFDTAQSYYQTFRPIVTMQSELFNFIPYTQSLGATVIAPPDLVNVMETSIRQAYPNVYFDLIVADDVARVRALFETRVRTNRRFG